MKSSYPAQHYRYTVVYLRDTNSETYWCLTQLHSENWPGTKEQQDWVGNMQEIVDFKHHLYKCNRLNQIITCFHLCPHLISSHFYPRGPSSSVWPVKNILFLISLIPSPEEMGTHCLCFKIILNSVLCWESVSVRVIQAVLKGFLCCGLT